MESLLLSPKQQSATDDQARHEQVDDAETHDVLGVEFGDGQSRQSPERLDEVGPGIAPRDSHARQAGSHTQSCTRREHNRRLDSPVTAARRHEHVQDGRAEEGKQGISLWR